MSTRERASSSVQHTARPPEMPPDSESGAFWSLPTLIYFWGTLLQAGMTIPGTSRLRWGTLPGPPLAMNLAQWVIASGCWFWEGMDLFKLKGKQHEGSLMWRSGGGAERRGGGVGGCTPPPVTVMVMVTAGDRRQTLQATL